MTPLQLNTTPMQTTQMPLSCSIETVTNTLKQNIHSSCSQIHRQRGRNLTTAPRKRCKFFVSSTQSSGNGFQGAIHTPGLRIIITNIIVGEWFAAKLNATTTFLILVK